VKRFLIILGSLALLGFISVSAYQQTFRGGSQAYSEPLGAIDLETKRIPLNPDDLSQTQVGELHYLGGLVLTSSHIRFGGFSGLHVVADGSEILSISDRGLWFRASPLYENGQLSALQNATLGHMRGLNGGPLQWQWSDAEAITMDDQNRIYVGLEYYDRILGYQLPGYASLNAVLADDSTPVSNFKPPKDVIIPPNGGIESLVSLAPDQLLAITEEAVNPDGTLIGWIIEGDSFTALAYQPHDSYSPVSLAKLPNGDVMALERRYNPIQGVSVRLCVIARQQITPANILSCETIAEIAAPINVDNFEALAIRQNAQQDTLVYLLSDDNFNQIQDTMMMMFKWVPTEDSAKGGRPGRER
jgi:hypothetical protein